MGWDLFLEGTRAIVTGATSGIGRAVVRGLVEQGVIVAAIGRRRAALDELVEELGPGAVVPIQADLSRPDAAGAMCASAVAALGGVDLVVNDAGVGYRASVADTSLEQWEATFALDVTAPFLVIRALIPHFLERGGGTIVNVASVGGLIAIADRAAYTSAKAALIALTRSVTVDFASRGIRANCVAPGTTETPWIDRILADAPDAHALRDRMRERQVINRLAAPDEIANTILFLASPRSSFVHGATLVADGGYSIR